MLTPTTRRQLYHGLLICTIGGLFYCYEFVLRILPGALETELIKAFGNISASTFGQISAFYYFAYSPMQLPVGMLMDRFGPRRLLTFACVSCTIGSYLFCYPIIYIASMGRFLVGFGSSFAFVGVLSLAVYWLPKRFFSLIAGLITTLGMLGLIYGEIRITQLSAYYSLKHVLFIMVIIGIILSFFIYAVVRDGPNRNKNQEPWSLFFKEVFYVLSTPEIWIIGIIGTFLYTSLSVFGELWGKAYLMQAHGLSPIDAAKSVSMLFLGWGLGAPLIGYVSDWSGRRVLPIILGAFLSAITISIVLYIPHLSLWQLNSLLFGYGIFSSTEIIVFAMANEKCVVKLSGTVFAVINMIVTLGGVIFQPLVGILLDWFVHSKSHNYQVALTILPLSMIIVIFIALFIKDPLTKNRQ